MRRSAFLLMVGLLPFLAACSEGTWSIDNKVVQQKAVQLRSAIDLAANCPGSAPSPLTGTLKVETEITYLQAERATPTARKEEGHADSPFCETRAEFTEAQIKDRVLDATGAVLAEHTEKEPLVWKFQMAAGEGECAPYIKNLPEFKSKILSTGYWDRTLTIAENAGTSRFLHLSHFSSMSLPPMERDYILDIELGWDIDRRQYVLLTLGMADFLKKYETSLKTSGLTWKVTEGPGTIGDPILACATTGAEVPKR